MLTLSDGTTTITLPDSMEWVDEYSWSPIQQDIQFTIGGNLINSESTVTKGRPITLVSGEDVWVEKSVIDELITLKNTIDKTYTLTMPSGSTYTVKFDRRDNNELEAKPVFRQIIRPSTANYTLTIRLMEV